MSGFTGSGFITIDRGIEGWDLWRSLRGEQRMVVVQLLLMANWKPGAFWYGNQRIEVDRGELAYSLRSIADASGSSIKVVRGVLEKLLHDEWIVEKTGTQEGARKARAPRILRIRNYDRFQSVRDRSEAPEGTQTDTPRAHLGHTSGTPRAPIEPSKPSKPSNQKRSRASAAPVSDPRHAPLVRRLTDAYLEIRSDKYGFLPRDAKETSDLLVLGEPDEIERRWRVALKHVGFPSVSTLADLKSHWNRFSGTQPVVNGVLVKPPSPTNEFARKGDQPI